MVVEFHANLLSGEDVEQSEYVHDQDEMGLEQQYTGQHGDEEEDMQNIEPYSEHEHDLDYNGYNDYEHSPDQPDLPNSRSKFLFNLVNAKLFLEAYPA